MNAKGERSVKKVECRDKGWIMDMVIIIRLFGMVVEFYVHVC